MITTSTAPPWLRRSDQAVTWARTMLQPHRAVVIDCETTDLPGAVTGKVGYHNSRNKPAISAELWARSVASDEVPSRSQGHGPPDVAGSPGQARMAQSPILMFAVTRP
jgi:hypothetical protein